MKWEIVKVHGNEKKRYGHSVPHASVGFGRISINTAACDLIENNHQYQYAELLKGRQRNKLCIGIRFLTEEEKTPYAIPLRRRLRNGLPTGGVNIHGKQVLEELFGPAASASKSTVYNVAKDDGNDNILIIFAE